MRSAFPTVAACAALASFALGCADPYVEPLPPRDRLNYPVGITIHPEGRFLYVVNSNFDTRYREDVGGTLSVVDLETRELRPQASPFLPSFGGMIELNRDGTRAYVATRNQNAVVSLSVSPHGATVYCQDGEVTTSDPLACTLRRVPDVVGGAFVPSDPFALDVTTIDWESGDGVPFEIDLVNVAHLRGDNVTTIAIPRTEDAENPLASSMQSASLIAGGSAIERRPGTRDIYVGGRLSREIAIFFPYLAPGSATVQALIRRGTIQLGNVGESVDTRGLAFDETGDTLFVVTRVPDALHIVDLGPRDVETGAGTLDQVVASIPVARNPSGVFPHAGADGNTLLYVPSFDEEIVQVVDPTTRAVIDRIELGAKPYDMEFDVAPGTCTLDGPCHAYVSLFNDLAAADGRCEDHRTETCGSIGIIDVDPQSPRFHQLIGKID